MLKKPFITKQVFFLESICTDKRRVEENIKQVKLNGPDYLGKDPESGMNDFKKRIKQYKEVYEPLDRTHDSFVVKY